jgi:hypothetical protein
LGPCLLPRAPESGEPDVSAVQLFKRGLPFVDICPVPGLERGGQGHRLGSLLNPQDDIELFLLWFSSVRVEATGVRGVCARNGQSRCRRAGDAKHEREKEADAKNDARPTGAEKGRAPRDFKKQRKEILCPLYFIHFILHCLKFSSSSYYAVKELFVKDDTR